MKKVIVLLMMLFVLSGLVYGADTGYNWGSWAFVQDADPSNWDDEALADTATETSGAAISLDGYAACRIGIQAVEDNTGAIDGICTVYVLADTDGTYYEETTTATYSFQFTPVQNDTVYVSFSIDPKHINSFKIAIFNDSGQELALDVRYILATIPAAS